MRPIPPRPEMESGHLLYVAKKTFDIDHNVWIKKEWD